MIPIINPLLLTITPGFRVLPGRCLIEKTTKEGPNENQDFGFGIDLLFVNKLCAKIRKNPNSNESDIDHLDRPYRFYN